ncbi:hypothetical protein SAMN05216388_103224 [Halorientalis persicus]|jgi:hypothetical protein|uniref:Uncharacterized protein n=1 Tax=Halorientalis persicus TaxID=1367881 RepID=A0A1H8V0T1_9EURY|nr:hypothetical protein [Halorientalis persicus]SEP09001.1 hypothetical protein SAMN05216388_103224 [Halorientalis persicus]
MTLDALRPDVSEGYAPEEVPLYRDLDTRDEQYERAQDSAEPFFAVEQYEEGYAVTYDLLPAGFQLAEPARQELDERLTRAVEGIVGDADRPTTEVSRTVGDSLGNVSFFGREDSAREVAAVISTIVLDENNWVTGQPPDATGPDPRRND